MEKTIVVGLLKAHEDFCEHSRNYIGLRWNNMTVLTFNSIGIEGANLTQLETDVFLKRNVVNPKKEKSDYLMTLDHYNALAYALELSADKKPITIEVLETINRIALKHSENVELLDGTESRYIDRSSGKIRDYQVWWGDHEFMHYSKIREALKPVIENINEGCLRSKSVFETYEVAFKTHYDLISIHPFGDGNSRTSRIMQNYIQDYHRMPLTTTMLEHKNEYKSSLMFAWKYANSTYFNDLMIKTTTEFFSYLKKEIKNNQ